MNSRRLAPIACAIALACKHDPAPTTSDAGAIALTIDAAAPSASASAPAAPPAPSPKEQLEERLAAWDAAQNAHDASAAMNVYGLTVKYYGVTLPRDAVQMKLAAYFTTFPDAAERRVHVVITWLGDGARVRFDKLVSRGGGDGGVTKTYAEYLHFANVAGALVIDEEGAATDKTVDSGPND